MITLAVWLISAIVCGAIGGWMANKDRIPTWIGVLVGAVAIWFAVLFFGGVYLAEHVDEWLEKVRK